MSREGKVCKVCRACDVKVGDELANLGKVVSSEEYTNGWLIKAGDGLKEICLFISKSDHLILINDVAGHAIVPISDKFNPALAQVAGKAIRTVNKYCSGCRKRKLLTPYKGFQYCDECLLQAAQ